MTGDNEPNRVAVVRPWGLRGLRPTPSANVPEYRYDPVQQVALTSSGELWIDSEKGKTWSSIAELDGDEGRSEAWGWDVTVLIVSQELDLTADRVVLTLSERGDPCSESIEHGFRNS